MSIRSISKELQEKAIKELNEDPKRIAADIEYIKEWIKQNQYLNARTDDQWILTFLRGCKFSLERTKEKLDMFYTMRSLCPEFFTNRDPMLPEIQKLLSMGLYLPLPNTATPDSPKVMYMKMGKFDPEIKITDVFKMNLMLQEILLIEDDQLIIAGHSFVQDMKEMTMSHMVQMTPTLVKKVMTCFHEAYPNRHKAQHFLNIPSFFEIIYGMFSPFLTEKLKQRMNIHTSNNWDDLYKTIPKHLLPNELGGEAGKCEELTAYWKKKVESYRDYFLEDEKHKTDESKRPGKPKTTDNVFGVEGSFRKLDVF